MSISPMLPTSVGSKPVPGCMAHPPPPRATTGGLRTVGAAEAAGAAEAEMAPVLTFCTLRLLSFGLTSQGLRGTVEPGWSPGKVAAAKVLVCTVRIQEATVTVPVAVFPAASRVKVRYVPHRSLQTTAAPRCWLRQE